MYRLVDRLSVNYCLAKLGVFLFQCNANTRQNGSKLTNILFLEPIKKIKGGMLVWLDRGVMLLFIRPTSGVNLNQFEEEWLTLSSSKDRNR